VSYICTFVGLSMPLRPNPDPFSLLSCPLPATTHRALRKLWQQRPRKA
jgi:hypothetical protein